MEIVGPTIAGFFRMRHRVLVARGLPDHLADADDVAGLVRGQAHPECGGVRHRVGHAAVGDVHRQGAEPGDLHRDVEGEGERRNVLERDEPGLAAFDLGPDRDQPRRRLEHELGEGLVHGHHAGLDEDGGHADRVAARHRRVLALFHDDEAGGGPRVGGWQDHVAAHRGVPARFAQHAKPDVVVVLREVGHLLEHGRPGDVGDTADDDATRFACGMGVHRDE